MKPQPISFPVVYSEEENEVITHIFSQEDVILMICCSVDQSKESYKLFTKTITISAKICV